MNEAANPPKAGDVFPVKYPFLRCDVEVMDFEGPGTIKSWRPGVEFVPVGQYGEDSEAECDACGEMILTVVGVFKPGRFPTRVFFTRQWVTPEGKRFGKGGLHVTTLPAFKRRAAGYMHEYRNRSLPSSGTEGGE